MKKSSALFTIFLSFVLLSYSNDNIESITLGVEYTVRIPVEYVTISVGIVESGRDLPEVEQEGYERLAAVVSLLTESGLNQEEMEINSGTVSHNIQRDETFRYNSSVIFDLYDLDKVDLIRRALVNAGATTFQITSYGNSEEEAIYEAAYQQAISSAKQRAEKLLANESVAPGRILNLHENVREIVDYRVRGISQDVEINISGGLSMGGALVPLFNKEYYTKSIVFNVEFALVEK